MIAQYAGTTNHAGLSMGVFFSFCFISFYGGGIDVVGYVYCCECIPIIPLPSMHAQHPGNANVVERPGRTGAVGPSGVPALCP